MEINLNLANEFTWQLKTLNNHLQNQTTEITCNLYIDLIPINQIVEHEDIVPSGLTSDIGIDELKQTIIKEGFLHPILLTKLNDKLWVVADGTHRLKAMTELKSHWILGIILPPNEFHRDAWGKIFHTAAQPLAEFTNMLSEKEKMSISIKPQDSFKLYNYSPSLLGYYRKDRKLFRIENKNFLDRHQHLNLIKKLDIAIDSSKIEYTTIKTIIKDNMTNDFLLLSPPLDSENDIQILVDNSSLRRPKGSKTVVKNRLIHLPVPFQVFTKSKPDALKSIANIINSNIQNNEMGCIHLTKSKTSSLDLSWYNHRLIIGAKFQFLKDLHPQEIKEIKSKFKHLTV